MGSEAIWHRSTDHIASMEPTVGKSHKLMTDSAYWEHFFCKRDLVCGGYIQISFQGSLSFVRNT